MMRARERCRSGTAPAVVSKRDGPRRSRKEPTSSPRSQLAAKNDQVDALSRYALLARDRYEGGYTSYLEVLDSERSLFSAQLEQSTLRGTEFGQLVQLYKALGGGWPVDSAPQASASTPASPAKE